MTQEKIIEVHNRLKKRYQEYINEGYATNFATRQARMDIGAELRDEGFTNADAVFIMHKAKELKNEK